MRLSTGLSKSGPKNGILLLSCILAPLVEEGLFRGLLQTGLKKLSGQLLPRSGAVAVAILATSLLFGITHLLAHEDLESGMRHVKIATIAGVFLGVLREKYGLPCSIGSHMFQNTIAENLDYGIEVFKWFYAFSCKQ